ncbi:MAG: ABC transporter ATP-binding protein [Desulfobacteraceae bacterium]|nr:ABC transporter ATP-binding protein [Desulfobacteraceae bacterium]
MKDDLVICFTHLSKRYHTDLFGRAKPALADLSLEIRAGEVLGIVGPNGAGKSTTIKILMGFVFPDRGEVTLNGLPAADPAAHAQVGYLPENPCLYDKLSIHDHLIFAAQVARLAPDEAEARIAKVLQRVRLAKVAKTPVRKFSKGMTQRAALAYALLHDPELLILDEPMSGLDPLGRELVAEVIREYRERGRTILFCSHILTDVERICSRIGLMHQGRLVADLRPPDLPAPPTGRYADKSPLEAFFLNQVAGNEEGNDG